MNCNSTLKPILVFLMLVSASVFAQDTYKYKIVFATATAKENAALKTLLTAYSSSANPEYSKDENAVIIASAKAVNKNSLIGKLEKMNVQVAAFEELQNTSVVDVQRTAPANAQEMQDKETKSKQQMQERQNKQVQTESNKRF